MLVLDNSEWMRNGDYTPSRWDAQSDAVNVLFDAKTNAHPENMIGVLTMAGKSPAVLATLTQDISKVFAGIHSSKLSGTACKKAEEKQRCRGHYQLWRARTKRRQAPQVD